MQRLEVEIWSDIACPWCYVGKRRFEAALAAFAERDRVRLRWRAFELDPTAPRVRESEPGYVERLARKYRLDVGEAQAMIDRMTAVGAEEGIDFRFDRIVAGNTFDAHRLIHHAGERGDAMKERLLRAYFCEGEAIGDPDVLARLAGDLDFDERAILAMLASDAHREAVRADEAEAAALEIHGVPFFVVGGRYGVSGAQPPSELLQVLERAFGAGTSLPANDAACGPDGFA
jgi:predicted DsbA family dithiol-disulfide isomerase